MTKADIVNEISKNTGIEKITVQKTVDFMEAVKDSLNTNKNVYLGDLVASLSRKGRKKPQGISRKIQPSSFPPIIFLRLNLQNPL
jgi:DNA-binding protein HU-beta